jgi:Fe2+ or Zn2+ uptake regulation protein
MKSKLRLTSARKAVLEFLQSTPLHHTAAEIHESLTDRLPSLNLSTVYRSLDYLIVHRLVSVADIGQGSPVYEIVSNHPHHHLVCLNCEHVFHLDDDIVNPMFKQIKEGKNFEIRTNHLVLYGICESCQAEN